MHTEDSREADARVMSPDETWFSSTGLAARAQKYTKMNSACSRERNDQDGCDVVAFSPPPSAAGQTSP